MNFHKPARSFWRKEVYFLLAASQLLLTAPDHVSAADSPAASTTDRLVTGLSQVNLSLGKFQSPLELASSSHQLVNVFNWAKAQATAFVHDNGDPVGPWYEAVEPGREGFCIRDTCHQALGAQALGLARFNLNMLHHFAGAISDSKDWCSYWEINRFNQPCPVDYQNDTAFWYNLPANFDLLDTCYRMYVWSGDLDYVNDPVFLNFYDRTVNDYVRRWALGIDQIMIRPRLLNARGVFDPAKKFPKNRGIPGYNEGDPTYVIGFDVLATQRAAYRAYAEIQQARQNGELSDQYLEKASEVENLITNVWWDNSNQCYYARLDQDHQLEGNGRRNRSLSADWHMDVTSDAGGFARPDDTDAAMARLLDISHARLDYPEVSFTRIGDIVSTAMGVNLEYSSPLLSAVEVSWVEIEVKTLSGLGKKVGWAELRNLPIRDNLVTIRHDGMRKTTFTNQSGPALIWLAMFDGAHEQLLVNGRLSKAKITTGDDGRILSSVRVSVGAGGTVSVETPK